MTNLRRQLFFGMACVNFKGMREERERKQKNSFVAQPDLCREHALHFQKEDDSPLSTLLRMEDFGNLMAHMLHRKNAGVVTR
jgi:hypothetical protein